MVCNHKIKQRQCVFKWSFIKIFWKCIALFLFPCLLFFSIHELWSATWNASFCDKFRLRATAKVWVLFGRHSWEVASSIFLVGILLRRKSSECNSEIIVSAIPPLFVLLGHSLCWGLQDICLTNMWTALVPGTMWPHRLSPSPACVKSSYRKETEGIASRSLFFITVSLTVQRYSVVLFIVMHLNGHFHTQLFQARVSSAWCPIAHRK